MAAATTNRAYLGISGSSRLRARSYKFASSSSSISTKTTSRRRKSSSSSSSRRSTTVVVSSSTSTSSAEREGDETERRPILVVSDLDGTMVGDDQSTSAFRTFWEGEIRDGRSKLVYSTGRSLESFRVLLSEKREVMVEPEMLICAVGTKVYSKTEEEKWVEDEEWTRTLDVGWDESIVRAGCAKAIELCGEESAHFRPEEEQNAHKITCGLKDEKLGDFVETLEKYLKEKNVTAKIISSGTGGWKYVDCVSNQAGKLESLEFVRKKLGFEVERTVACGDSGNDELMLSGKNLAIVVGNAQEDLVRWAEKALLEGEEVEKGGKGSSKKRVVVTKAFEARGIIEGIRTHFF